MRNLSCGVLLAIGFTAALTFAGCGSGATIGGPGRAPTARPSTNPTATPAPAASATPAVTPTPTPSATPVKIGSDTVFASIGSPGVEAFSTTGTALFTYANASGAREIGIDDAGDTFVLAVNGFDITILRYAIGSQSSNATYAPTSGQPQVLFAAPGGELVVGGAGSDAQGNATGIFDVWDPGVTGAPSRTLTYPGESLGTLNGAMAADGTFYVPYTNASGHFCFDAVAPGTAAAKSTTCDTLAAANSNFSAAAMAVAADGTLYAGEWTYESPDPNAGLYVFPSAGSETRVTSGATNPTSIDFDASGAVYVANSNATFAPDDTLSTDTLHQLSVFTAGGASLSRSVTAGLDDPQNVAVDADGTAYLVDFANADQTNSPIETVAPGATAATLFAATADATNAILYDGTAARSARTRSHAPAPGRSVRAVRLRRFRTTRGSPGRYSSR